MAPPVSTRVNPNRVSQTVTVSAAPALFLVCQ